MKSNSVDVGVRIDFALTEYNALCISRAPAGGCVIMHVGGCNTLGTANIIDMDPLPNIFQLN